MDFHRLLLQCLLSGIPHIVGSGFYNHNVVTLKHHRGEQVGLERLKLYTAAEIASFAHGDGP